MFYDPARRSKISSDASKDGLGAVLLQEHDGSWLPVAFISRAMTSAEKNYTQIEKELLGLVFACEKFHEYVYGATVIEETDHKPLVSLHKKNMCENHIGRCGTCQKHRYKQAKEPMEQHEIPEKPWRKIGADLFPLFGKNFLVVVDYTSNYPEVAKLEGLSSTNTISHMKSIMARHGLPSVVVSDNGPQFSSREFRQFAMQYGFKHETSSLEYPQSN